MRVKIYAASQERGVDAWLTLYRIICHRTAHGEGEGGNSTRGFRGVVAVYLNLH